MELITGWEEEELAPKHRPLIYWAQKPSSADHHYGYYISFRVSVAWGFAPMIISHYDDCWACQWHDSREADPCPHICRKYYLVNGNIWKYSSPLSSIYSSQILRRSGGEMKCINCENYSPPICCRDRNFMKRFITFAHNWWCTKDVAWRSSSTALLCPALDL